MRNNRLDHSVTRRAVTVGRAKSDLIDAAITAPSAFRAQFYERFSEAPAIRREASCPSPCNFLILCDCKGLKS